ncbi:MAG TPA: hypothetical protein VGE52_06140 [Pirellulales bacterium]
MNLPSRLLQSLRRRSFVVAAATCLSFAPNFAAAEDAPAIDPGVFDRLDANKDGSIAPDEVSEDAKRMFQRLLRTSDANGDEKLTKAEFEAGMAKGGPTSETGGFAGGRGPGGPRGDFNPEQMFKRLDANKDGKLTVDEFPEERREMVRKGLSRFDDGDGALSTDEFANMMAAVRGNQPAEKPGESRNAPEGGEKPEMEMPGDERPAGSPIFAALDADGDGALTSAELASAADRLRKFDANGDGKITREEIGAGRGEGGRGPGRLGLGGLMGGPNGARPGVGMMVEMLKRADKDGDGKLSKEETPERLRERFGMLDGNADGFLDEAEIKGGLEKVREAMGNFKAGGNKNKPE